MKTDIKKHVSQNTNPWQTRPPEDYCSQCNEILENYYNAYKKAFEMFCIHCNKLIRLIDIKTRKEL